MWLAPMFISLQKERSPIELYSVACDEAAQRMHKNN